MEGSYEKYSITKSFHQHSDMVYRIALNMVRSISAAEDITQEVFLKLIEKQLTFESKQHEKAWLIRVTINYCKNYLKSGWFRKTTELTEDIPYVSGIEYTLEQKELYNQLMKLKELERTIVYLYYYEEYTLAEIAKILEMNSNTVATKLRRAKEKLKFQMKGGVY
ncbi:RNA polymerase sigma factor [Lachnoclostridium sp.]|uniref:RNA polymerase sigma factor n=1 Tax=Lachnoclostridium sp. TaxID=2028282 RepID=UPI0028990C58|nr:sigma-70 family RNA polymerase sigma factor [Lachnoclostridium sp.]